MGVLLLLLALLPPLLDGRRGGLGRRNELLLALGVADLGRGGVALFALALGGGLLLAGLEEVLSGLELLVELGQLGRGREGSVYLLLLGGGRSVGGRGSGAGIAERGVVGVCVSALLCVGGVLAGRLLRRREVLLLEL
jgi:hypothetical protein